nr:hypothetical protein [Myxococcota bacterium]
QGFFGSAGEQSFEGEPQNAKVPHMRNLYAKIGMFSVGGDQVRGFGFLHDGSVDTLKSFLEAGVFDLSNGEERDLEDFSLAFPSDLAPIVGQQVTLTATNAGVADPRIDLLIQRAGASFTSLVLGGAVTECDLVVKGSEGGVARGWLRQSNGLFLDDTGATKTDGQLRALAASDGPLTYTCVPPGSGDRTGIDRDQDTLLDGVETNTGVFVGTSDTGSNPALRDSDGDGFDDDVEVFNLPTATDPNDPQSFPGAPPAVPVLSPLGLGGLAGALLLTAAAALRRPRET